MIFFPFYKFSPSGNTTVFLEGSAKAKERAHYCRLALSPEGVGGEQAGFVNLSQPSLSMGGGEFCANASRALGALLDLHAGDDQKERRYSARVSGLQNPVSLSVGGRIPRWSVAASFSLPDTRLEKAGEKKYLAAMQGITHLLLETDKLPEANVCPALARPLFVEHDLNAVPAAGIVWWKKCGQILEIRPFVQVPEAGTAMLESACGSASIALACLLDASACKIRQPAGEVLEISRRGTKVTVEGTVTLCGAGQLWLPKRAGGRI